MIAVPVSRKSTPGPRRSVLLCMRQRMPEGEGQGLSKAACLDLLFKVQHQLAETSLTFRARRTFRHSLICAPCDFRNQSHK